MKAYFMLSSAFLYYSLTAVVKSVGFQLCHCCVVECQEKKHLFCKIIQVKTKLRIGSSFCYYFCS